LAPCSRAPSCASSGTFADAACSGSTRTAPTPTSLCDPESNFAASAVSVQTPPAGPQWLSGLAPPDPHPLAYDKPLCASLDGFTLHAASVPPPRFHTVRYAGVLAAASPWRPRVAPKPPTQESAAAPAEPDRTGSAGGYRPWAELLARTFVVDVLACPACHGRMRLVAMIKEPASIVRYLAAVGEATEVPRRSPEGGPPHWKSRVLRRQVLGYEEG